MKDESGVALALRFSSRGFFYGNEIKLIHWRNDYGDDDDTK